jgi:hypothetical protein
VIEIKAKAVILRICGVLMKSVLMSGFMIDWCGGGGGGGGGGGVVVAGWWFLWDVRIQESQARAGARVS